MSAENETNQDGLVTYTLTDIENILSDWVKTAKILYYFIEHPADEEISTTHFHILIRFANPMPFSAIKSKFPYGDIEPARNCKNCIQYMVHLNDPSKKPYPWEAIHTNDPNTDWYKVMSQSRAEISLQSIIDRVVSGEIRQYNQCKCVPPELWTKYRARISNAFDYYTELVCMDKDRDITTIYFSGSTGLGKTTFAKQYCELRGLSYCISSASNDPLQDYKGEDVLILDDFRGDVRKGEKHRSFEFHDFLKLLDPHTRSTGKSRYHNKAFIGDLIIITSTRPLYDLYFDLDIEDKQQLYRRIGQQYQFREDKILIFEYSEKYKKYQFIGSMPNVIKMPKKRKIDIALTACEAFGVEFSPAASEAIEKLKAMPEDEFKFLESACLRDPNVSTSELKKAHREFIERKAGLSSIQEATEEEKKARKEYEDSLPPINQKNIEKYRIG